MNFRSLISNASVAFLAQGISFVMGCLTSLLVPKVLGVEEFGYWQLFIFYSTYVGFFHLGLNDGVYLVEGGKSRSEIGRRAVNSQMVVGIAFQTLFAVLIAAFAFASDLGSARVFVLLCTAYFMLAKNTALYLGYVFQAMNETKLYSFSCILERVIFLVPLAALLVLQVDSFQLYVLAYCLSTTCQLVYCLWHGRDFLASGFEAPGIAVRRAIGSIRIGCRLMLANIASQLILGVARFVIDAVWGIKTFGELSLSLSMVNFALAFVTQAAMVLFPALRQGGEHEVRSFFYNARNIMGLVFPAAYLLYFPGVWLLGMWLPQYANSFVFLAYLLPVCVFDSKMNIACTTYFKVAREESTLFCVNVAATIFSAAGTLLGAYVFKSVFFIIGSVTLAIILRSIYSEHRITRELSVSPCISITAGELVITVVFIVAATVLSPLVAFFIYLIAYLLFLVANRAHAGEILGKLRRLGLR